MVTIIVHKLYLLCCAFIHPSQLKNNLIWFKPDCYLYFWKSTCIFTSCSTDAETSSHHFLFISLYPIPSCCVFWDVLSFVRKTELAKILKYVIFVTCHSSLCQPLVLFFFFLSLAQTQFGDQPLQFGWCKTSPWQRAACERFPCCTQSLSLS